MIQTLNTYHHTIRRHTAWALLAAACLLAACSGSIKPYHHYTPLPQHGWARTDSVTFRIDTIPSRALYNIYVEVRTNAAYPYHNLSLSTGITLHPCHGDAPAAPPSTTRHTSHLSIIDHNGTLSGQGISRYTHTQHVASMALQPGDSLTIKVAHHMQREVMPGITDVGIKLQPQ